MYRNIDLYLKLEAVIDPLADAVQIQEADSVGFTEVQRQVLQVCQCLSHTCQYCPMPVA